MKRNNAKKVLMLASVASMIDQFNLPNIRLMQELGYEVHVACNFQKGNTCDRKKLDELQRELTNMHVTIHPWDCPRSAYSVFSCIRAYRSVRRLMEEQRFAWMHCQSPVGGALARLAGHKLRLPVVYTAHGFHFYQGAPFWNWLLYYPAEKLLSYWTDVLVTVNREDYQLAKRSLNAGKTCYIPGIGIDAARFLGGRRNGERKAFCRNCQIPENAVVLLSVGELSKRKNHREVLAALARMKNQNIYYLICGQGKCKARLLRQAARLGIQNKVRLLGFQKDVGRLYRNADIFVFPSIQEGLPAALMEAMASGLACVVSDIRGNRELIDAAGGIRYAGKPFKKQRIKALQDALELVCADQALRLAYGEHNRQKIKNYDWNIVGDRMRQIYMQFTQT